MILEEELNGVNMVATADLEDLPRLALIDSVCGDRKVIVHGLKLTRNIKQKEEARCFTSL